MMARVNVWTPAAAALLLSCATAGPRGASLGGTETGGGASTNETLPGGEQPYEGPRIDFSDKVTLGPGDAFQVRVYLHDDLSGDYRVDSDGNISFPLIGLVAVDGRTPSKLASEMRERLADGYLKEPEVTVYLKEFNSKKVFIFGQVKRPGTYAYENDMSIIHAITTAGGFTQTAARNRTNVTRMVGGSETRVTVPVDAIVQGRARNYSLRPGDIVYVPESYF